MHFRAEVPAELRNFHICSWFSAPRRFLVCGNPAADAHTWGAVSSSEKIRSTWCLKPVTSHLLGARLWGICCDIQFKITDKTGKQVDKKCTAYLAIKDYGSGNFGVYWKEHGGENWQHDAECLWWLHPGHAVSQEGPQKLALQLRHAFHAMTLCGRKDGSLFAAKQAKYWENETDWVYFMAFGTDAAGSPDTSPDDNKVAPTQVAYRLNAQNDAEVRRYFDADVPPDAKDVNHNFKVFRVPMRGLIPALHPNGWRYDFLAGEAGNHTPNAWRLHAIAERLKRPGTQHLFIYIHGVGTDFGPFNEYLARWQAVADMATPQLMTYYHAATRQLSNVTVLGYDWDSQEMGTMLENLLHPGLTMPAKTFAEGRLLQDLLDVKRRLGPKSELCIHLVGHSMGSQVLLYLYPALRKEWSVHSMMFLQGFASSTAFSASTQKNVPQSQSRDGLLDEYNLVPPADGDRFVNESVDHMNAQGGTLRGVAMLLKKFNLANVVKRTDFYSPNLQNIVATTTPDIWSDYQVAAGEMTAYSASGVLGVRGFVTPGTKGHTLHFLHEDKIFGGEKSYTFDGTGEHGFHNLGSNGLITDHDDFKSMALALAHMRAAGLIGAQPWSPPPLEQFVTQGAKVRINDRNAARWMTDNRDLLAKRRLRDICMPGSHDAGTGIVRHRIAPADKRELRKLLQDQLASKLKSYLPVQWRNYGIAGLVLAAVPSIQATIAGLLEKLSRTQTYEIAGQLERGCRYFDLRPAISAEVTTPSPSGDRRVSEFHLAHGDRVKIGDTDLGHLGVFGERLEDALSAVKAFVDDPSRTHELVILNFSHALDWSASRKASANFTKEQVANLWRMISTVLGDRLINDLPADARLDLLNIEQLLSGKSRVLCLFDHYFRGPGDNSWRAPGMYFYVDMWSGESLGCDPQEERRLAEKKLNMRLLDSYADSRNPARVIEDQMMKLRRFRQMGGDATFLLSWTRTLKPNLALGDMQGVIDVARTFNPLLRPVVEWWIRLQFIDHAYRPGVVFVDDFGASKEYQILETVELLNNLR